MRKADADAMWPVVVKVLLPAVIVLNLATRNRILKREKQLGVARVEISSKTIGKTQLR